MAGSYERIEELDPPRLAKDEILDPGIEKLARVLDKLGSYTLGSCEGHLYGSHPYPWVTVWRLGVDENLAQRYNQLFEEFNTRSNIKWVVEGMGVRPSIEATNNDELKKLQESANSLANYLFKKYISRTS